MKPKELYSAFLELDEVEKKDFISLLFKDYTSDVLVNAFNSNPLRRDFPSYINTYELKKFLSDKD